MNEKFFKDMFGIPKIPNVDFSLKDISQEAQKFTGKLSISGVQPKLTVKLDVKKNLLIPTAEGGEYILKPQTAAFPNIPENEQCCMDIAGAFNIDIPPHCLIFLKDNSLAYAVKRFDRDKRIKIHQESFAQILQQTDKYRGSVEQIAKKLKAISSFPGYDVQLFFERIILNFILGNGDAHLKNYSVSYKASDNVRLSPAYDIVCSKLVIPGEEDSAITINGKRSKLQRNDFDNLAENLNIPGNVRYEKFENRFDDMAKIIESSMLSQEKKLRFIEIVKERLDRLWLK